VAGQSLGDLGPGEGRPTIVAWKWYYHAGGVPSWLLMAVLLVGLKENRHRQAWLIFLPLAVLAIVWRMATRLLMVSDDSAEWLGIVMMSCATAWATVWLVGPWFARRHWSVRFIAALVLMLVVGELSCLSRLGFESTEDVPGMSIAQGICSAGLLAAMMLGGRSCRDGFRRGRLMGWLFVWMAILALASLSLLMGIMVAVSISRVEMLLFAIIALIQVAIGSAFLAAVVYLFNLPFMVLAFRSPFYRARFHCLFCPETFLTAELAVPDTARYAPPLSTDPTQKPVSVADVAGPCEFYLDEASSTVVVDFNPDGTFAQTVMPNRGGAQRCPGGTWRLEGPLVQLTGYVTAKEGIPQAKTWWMVDTSQGLALFGGETKFFCMLRGQQDGSLDFKPPQVGLSQPGIDGPEGPPYFFK